MQEAEGSLPPHSLLDWAKPPLSQEAVLSLRAPSCLPSTTGQATAALGSLWKRQLTPGQ